MNYWVFISLWLLVGSAFGQGAEQSVSSSVQFVPAGFVVMETIRGDLNRDGLIDEVLIIKATDPANIIHDEFRGALDRNRRGMIIAFQNQMGFERVLERRDCFSSEFEDGGVYFAPELEVFIRKGSLFVHYGHGRYGDWGYQFRYQNADFELIGYDNNQNQGPITERSISVNLMTKKIRIKENLNPEAEESGTERFKERWQTFTRVQPIRLRTIDDFDGFDVMSVLGAVR